MGRRNFFGRKKDAKSSKDNGKSEKRRSGNAGGGDINANTSSASHQLNSLNRRKLRDRAKSKNENNRSIRKMKKRDVVKQMLQVFPKENKESSVTGSYDLTKVHSQAEFEEDQDYASRKLMIRQMQGMIAKGVAGGRGESAGSEYDSWSDLEENFARAYEPIPLDIDIATWRKMTKNDIINTVRSKKMRKDFEYMSRSEILVHIEKMQKSAKYLSAKFGVDHLLPQLDHVAQVHHPYESDEDDDNIDDFNLDEESSVSSHGTNFSRNAPQYLSRSEILRVYQQDKGRRAAPPAPAPDPVKPSRPPKTSLKKTHDSWSSRASSILKNPESIYVSREEVLKNLDHRKPLKGGEVMSNAVNGRTKASKLPDNAAKLNANDKPVAKNKQSSVKDHDSWSSRASSILAKLEAQPTSKPRHHHQVEPPQLANDPPYVSRAELIERLADIAYDTLSCHTSTSYSDTGSCCSSSDSSSNASTVKNVVLKSRLQLNSMGSRDEVVNKPHEKARDKSSEIVVVEKIGRPTDKNITHPEGRPTIISKSNKSSVTSTTTNDEQSLYSLGNSDCDTCSCTSCEEAGLYYSDCSCCNGIEEDYEVGHRAYSYSSSSCSSNCTVVNGGQRHTTESEFSGTSATSTSSSTGRDKRNNSSAIKDVYVVNQKSNSQSSATSSKHSGSKKASPVKEAKQKLMAKEEDLAFSWKKSEAERLYEPISVREIKRQKNARAIKKHLREMAIDWDSKINDLNTLRRGHVLKELKKFLREKINFDNVQPEEINREVEVLLREALDSNFEALSNKNVGQMYIPESMHEPPMSSKLGSMDNTTDYDTFGSIDSLIFEPKVGSKKYIKQAQEAIEKQFQYLNQEDDGGDTSFDEPSPSLAKNKKSAITGPGKTTFAERVKLFQNLGKGGPLESSEEPKPPLQRPVKKITFLDVTGQETSWKELAVTKNNDKKSEVQEEPKNSYQEQLDDPGQEVSLCPDCNNPIDLSMSTCSICDCCTQCAYDDDDASKKETTEGPVSEDWQFLHNQDDGLKKIQEENSFSCDSVIDLANKSTKKDHCGDNDALRKQLKEGFKDFERNLDDFQPTDSFLEEYATRHSLVIAADEGPAVLVRREGTVQLTEDMFRGDLKGTLKKFGRNNSSVSHESKKKQGSEMGDSGISSPPAAQSLLPVTNSTTRSPDAPSDIKEESPDDSGMEESGQANQGKVALPGMKKRDTMIRELKSKLKEKFHVDSESSSEQTSLNHQGNPEQTLPTGTVISRRESMGPKLNKIFGNAIMKQNQSKRKDGIPSAQRKHAPVAVLPTSKDPPPVTRGSQSSLTSSASFSSSARSNRQGEKITFKSIYENKHNNIEVASKSSGESCQQKEAEFYSETDGSVYDPSLPDEMKKAIPAGVMFRANRPFTPPVAPKEVQINTKAKISGNPGNSIQSKVSSTCSGCGGKKCGVLEEKLSPEAIAAASPADRREFLYGPGGIFGPKGPFSTPMVRYPHGLELQTSSSASKRSVSFETTNRKSLSDCSSAMAEDRSVKSHYVVNSIINAPETPTQSGAITSRMETYRAEWADQARNCFSMSPVFTQLMANHIF